MSLEKITQQEIYDASMERLANYPTAASRYGIGGLNDRQLKARYDKLAKLAIAKLNVLIDSINAPAESADALLKLLITPIQGETEDVYLTLCDVLEDVISGDLATYLALTGLAKGNLQAELEELERQISDKVSKIAGKGLSTNDFGNAEKAALAANTEARHVHLNKAVLDSTTASYTTEEKDKLKAIEKGAQVNPKIIDNLTSVSADNPLSANQGRLLNEKVDGKQPAGNYATLVDGKIPSSQLPSYVDDVIEKPTRSEFPEPGESGKIYVAQDTNITYRWSGTGYVEISESLALGETAQTAFRGDHGKLAFEHSQSSGNPHGTTAKDIGIFIKQGTGDSENAVMSQKAVTAALAEKLTKLSAGTSELAYTVQTNGAQSSRSITESATGGTIVKRTSGGEIKASDPTSDDSVATMRFVEKQVQAARNIAHYGARWNKTQAQMTRMYDAASFPTAITNFAHRGSVNANYSNPFDSIYPWAGIKLCNISIDLYRNLAAGDSITKCVTAWEGDVDFSYNDANGVWRYRPEFWGKSWEDDTYRYFDVSEKAIGSYVHYPEAIVGRWHGRKENRTIGGEEKDCLIPSVGMPAKSISLRGLHTRAKNFGATLDSLYSVDADTLLCIVEFATMHTQNAIGNGVSNLYRQSSDLIQEDATNSTTVKVLAAAGSAYCIPGAIFDIGTSNGGAQVGSFVVVSATPNVGDAQYLDVTLDQAVTVTGANYWSVHGLVNVADEAIGSKSGYIGENGKCNAYYRGIVMFGNMWFYILGAYENKDDHHIWIANSDAEADNHDALDTTVHYDTGLVLPTARGYTKKLGLLSRSGLLSIPAFCVETGGDSSNPVGDYFYNGSYTYNTVLLRGGPADSGSSGGAFYGDWGNAASSSGWGVSARPRLKNP